jgi:hypothetical protein
METFMNAATITALPRTNTPKSHIARRQASITRRPVPDVGNLRARALAAKQEYLLAVDLYAFDPSPELWRLVVRWKRIYRELTDAAMIAETPV